MTEAERIIKEGLLPIDYLMEEVKDAFLVTSERKKLFAVLFEMLVKFDNVCKKYNLRYFLDGGTLIGAIRHKGFIPWDDDIDVVMPREDYENFIRLGDEFCYPLFLQTPYTDPEYFYMPARIRNSNTTALVPTFAYQKFNHGVWLSIFPIDDISEIEGEEVCSQIRSLILQNSTYMRITNPHLSIKDIERVKKWEGRNPLEVYEEIQRIATQFNNKGHKYVTSVVSAVLPYKKKLWCKEDFSSTVLVDFEGYKFPAPVGYDRILKTVFGNYMELPPIEERGKHHSDTIFDADIPYEEYLISNYPDFK